MVGGSRVGPAVMNRPEPGEVTGPLLLDSREVASLLGLGRTKVFQMMARAELPVVRVGRCVRVPRLALLAWIDSQTEPAQSVP